MKEITTKIFISHATTLIGAAVAASLGMAYIAEYGFKLLPCELCLMQRKPFFAVLALAAIAFFLRKPIQRNIILAVMGVLLLGNSGLALYHTGVEQKWWQGPTECSSDEMQTGLSMEEMRAQILAAPLIRCDVPAWEFHGITMASLNIFFCLFLALFSFWSLYAITRRQS
jgi:disulfide bond formation protein DsbB